MRAYIDSSSSNHAANETIIFNCYKAWKIMGKVLSEVFVS